MEAPSLIAIAYGMVHQGSGEKGHQKGLYQKKASQGGDGEVIDSVQCKSIPRCVHQEWDYPHHGQGVVVGVVVEQK